MHFPTHKIADTSPESKNMIQEIPFTQRPSPHLRNEGRTRSENTVKKN